MTTFIIPRGCAINGMKAQINGIVECAKKQHPEWSNFDRDSYFFNIDEKFIIEHSECFKYEMKEIGTKGLIQKYNGMLAFEMYGEWPEWVSNAIEEITRGKRIDRW
jgi:hypothetical protein